MVGLQLLQGWGGELGNFKNTKEGQAFLNELDQISIQSIRGVIRKLIDQGLDKEHRERMTNQQLLVVMSATVPTALITTSNCWSFTAAIGTFDCSIPIRICYLRGMRECWCVVRSCGLPWRRASIPNRRIAGVNTALTMLAHRSDICHS
jgi:hypothetical protein